MIRRALPQELPAILRLYAEARSFMAEQGNPTQWGKSSPAQNVLEEDIRKQQLYICERDGRLCGVFAFPIGEDPAYRRVEGGSWLSDSSYGTIHRLAGERTEKGIFEECLSWCRSRIGHIRIDTHEDNRIMQAVSLLVNSGIGILRLQEQQMSLEDIFLHLTGKQVSL